VDFLERAAKSDGKTRTVFLREAMLAASEKALAHRLPTHVFETMRQIDGLASPPRPWKGNVFLNPPGGTFKILNKSFSNAALWWAALVQDWLSGDVKQAIFIGFTLEILRHSQNGCPLPVQAFYRCYPKKRIKFSGAQQPTHANVIVYLPPTEMKRPPFNVKERWLPSKGELESGSLFSRFDEHFGSLGYCEP
jgi:hypothetical protein